MTEGLEVSHAGLMSLMSFCLRKNLRREVKTRAKHARRGVIPLRPHVRYKDNLLRHKNIRNIFFVCEILL